MMADIVPLLHYHVFPALSQVVPSPTNNILEYIDL
jgi:hypothetical protein